MLRIDHHGRDALRADGFAPTSDRDAVAWSNAVSDGFFATMGIQMLAGRDFDARDGATSAKVAIVSEAMARRFFGTPAAIGKRFEVQQGNHWSAPVEIVGVVGNTKYRTLRDTAEPIVYYPHTQQESEADRIGIELAAKAGYDLHAAPKLWEKMLQATGSRGQSDFLSTHPQSEKREEALAALIPQMMPYYDDKTPRPEYQFKTA